MSGDGKSNNGGLEASTILNFVDILGLGGAGRQGKARINWCS